MKESVLSILIIFLLLLAGYLSGRQLGQRVKDVLLGQIGNIVLILLLFMGIEFGEVFTQDSIGLQIVRNALMLAAIITVLTFVLLFSKNITASLVRSGGNFLAPFKGCAKAFAAFIAGLIIFRLTGIKLDTFYFSSNYILYFLIYLVGMDLVNFKITSVSKGIIKIPVITILATVCAIAIFSSLSHYRWEEALVVSSGFGWFSLSGPMVNQLVSPQMGAMAFMTDFFREMFSIVFLYFLGKSQPRSAIGISGAAALDSALPFIKENCEQIYIKDAIISGFLLTILAPFFITLSASLL